MSFGDREGTYFDYYSNDADSDGDDSGSDEHNSHHGYTLLTNDGSDSDCEVEFPEHVEQRQKSFDFHRGEEHDESYPAASTASSSGDEQPQDVEMEIDHNYDAANDDHGKTSSYSHCKISRAIWHVLCLYNRSEKKHRFSSLYLWL